MTVVLTVPAGEEDCYQMRIPYHSNINGNYNLIDDHLSPNQVRVIFTNEKGMALYRSKFGKDHGSFQVQQVEQGQSKFQICVQNAIPGTGLTKASSKQWDEEPRSVGITLRIDLPPAELYDEKMTSLLNYSDKVFAAVSDLAGHFEFRKFRESKHRQIVELIFTELLWWTLAQAIMVMAVAALQVYYLQRTVSRVIY